MDSYDWFEGWCATAASSTAPTLDKVADGRVFTGRQALELKLVDALGDEQAAVDWLAKEKGIDPKTPVRDYRLTPRFSDLPFLHVATVGAARRGGPDVAGRALRGLGRGPGGRAAQP